MKTRLDEASDRLNERLVAAERCIVERAPRVRTSVPLGSDEVVLIFGREGGVWGLYVQHKDAPPMPILKASREYRVLAAHALEDLAAAIRDAIAETMSEVEDAIKAVDAFIAAHATRSLDPNEGI